MSNHDIFIKANKALSSGNFDDFISYCSDDIKWENVGERTFFGKNELHKYISSVYTSSTFYTDKYLKDNDIIVEIGTISSSKNGIIQKRSYCDLWYFQNKQIMQVRSFVI